MGLVSLFILSVAAAIGAAGAVGGCWPADCRPGGSHCCSSRASVVEAGESLVLRGGGEGGGGAAGERQERSEDNNRPPTAIGHSLFECCWKICSV